MNPKIEELKKKAIEYYLDQPDLNVSVRELHVLVEEKFAELIIQECVEIAYSYDEPKMSGCGLIIGNSIETHFGIE